jgi:hypothetical protein
MRTILRTILLITASVGAVLSGTANATPITVLTSNMFYSAPDAVTINSARGNIHESVYSGAFSTAVTNQSDLFAAWCVDIYQATNFNESVADYTRVTGVTALGVSKANSLQLLANESLGRVHDSRTSSAFQLAIWEIVNETGSTFDLTRGTFSATGSSYGAIELANSWLTGLSSGGAVTRYDLAVLASPTRQDLAFFRQVPEPGTIALLALGILGFAVTRRKKT